MGTIWTPSGEYQPQEPDVGKGAAPVDVPGSGRNYSAPDNTAGGAPPSVMEEPLSPEELEAVRQLHAQLRSTPAVDIVANHVIQLFQLAVVYLGLGTPPDDQGRTDPPDLAQAGLVIDAMATLLEGLGTRFGEHEPTLRDAVSQLQLAYVQLAEHPDA